MSLEHQGTAQSLLPPSIVLFSPFVICKFIEKYVVKPRALFIHQVGGQLSSPLAVRELCLNAVDPLLSRAGYSCKLAVLDQGTFR